MRKVLVIAVFLAVPLALTGGLARASDADVAREHFVKGTRAYDLGLYDEAVAEYMAAYKLKDDPVFLFNIGQAHRRAGHPAEALRFYKTYLSKLPAADNRADVEAKIADLTKQLEQPPRSAEQPAPSPTTEAVPPASALPAEPPTQTARPPDLATPEPALVVANPGRGQRIAGVVTGAGGLLLLGAGVAFAVLARQAGNDLSDLDKNKGVFDPSTQDAGKRDQVLAAVLVGSGAAALATGTVLYLLGTRTRAAPSLAVLPSLTRASAGAKVQVVF